VPKRRIRWVTAHRNLWKTRQKPQENRRNPETIRMLKGEQTTNLATPSVLTVP